MTEARVPLWRWPNVLGMDAPVVALVWQDFIARCFAIPLRPTGRCALALTVWAIYLADRLLDVRTTPTVHPFCRRHPKLMLALLGAVLAADLLVCLLWLRRPVFWNGLLMMAGVVAYLDAFPLRRAEGPGKPVAAAALFAFGVFLVAWTNGAGHVLWQAAVVFGSLCLINLVLIRAWSQARRTWEWGAASAVLALACLWSAASAGASIAAWYAAVAMGAAGLAALAWGGHRVSRAARRVLADAVLLSPVLLWWPWTLAR